MKRNNGTSVGLALRVEFDLEPMALDVRDPRFSWILPVHGRGQVQTGYHILVASSPRLLVAGRADMWDSGTVDSAQSTHIVYSGKALASNRDYFWKVRVRESAGQFGSWSRRGRFSTALFSAHEWKARWIGAGDPAEPVSDPSLFIVHKNPPEIQAVEPDMRSPHFRKEFNVARKVRRARAFVCGLGFYELRINGRKAGDIALSPSRTEFRKRLYYDTFDVTGMVRRGANAVGISLGNGWYNGDKRYWGWQKQWWGSPRAILQVELEYADGATARVVTDATWKTAFGPITFNSIYDGEDYDARLELSGWDRAGFDDEEWKPAHIVRAPGGQLCSAVHPPVMIAEKIRPVSVKQVKPGTFVFDMGQNFTGWVRLKVKGPRGAKVKMRYAECQAPDGSIDVKTMGGVRAKLNYTLKGRGREVYAPRFTYCGFQYVEVSGYPGTPPRDALEGCFLHNALPVTGRFRCSHAGMNHIHDCMIRSQRSNLQLGVPTDDTQRGERLGWGADAWASAPQAMHNFDTPRFYGKWMRDFLDQQLPNGMVGMIAPVPGLEEDLVWSCAYTFIPWWQYVMTGDTRILREHYAALTRYMEFLASRGREDIEPLPEGTDPLGLPPETEPERRGHLQRSQWGDHLSTAEGFAGRSGLPVSITTAFYARNATVMAWIADALGKKTDALRYQRLFDAVRDAFNAKWFHPEKNCYDNGTQAPQAYALAFGLVPGDRVPTVLKSLIEDIQVKYNWHLTTGYPATPCLLDALAGQGRSDVIWRLANQKTKPGWLYMMKGRTTVPETWDGNGSWNHHALASPLDTWFYTALAGIQPDVNDPGYRHIVIKPYVPENLEWSDASIETVRGTVRSGWRKRAGRIRYTIAIPATATATVYLPAREGGVVKERGKVVDTVAGVNHVRREHRVTILEIGSGSYAFDVS